MTRGLPLRLAAILGIPLFVVLLPVLLPIAVAADALSERRLGRTKCANCGHVIGRAEIRRAKRQAGAEAHDRSATLIWRGLRPRIVTIWRIKCPTCGTGYQYRSGTATGLTPVNAT